MLDSRYDTANNVQEAAHNVAKLLVARSKSNMFLLLEWCTLVLWEYDDGEYFILWF